MEKSIEISEQIIFMNRKLDTLSVLDQSVSNLSSRISDIKEELVKKGFK